MNSNINRTIDEFCAVGKLEQFRPSLTKLFNDIESSGCRIGSRQDEKRSSHEFNGESCVMRMCLLDIYNSPLEIVWTILHEFGHHLMGKAPEKKIELSARIEREKIAWEKGRCVAFQFLAFAENIHDFDRFAETCLLTYLDAQNAKI